MKKFKSILILLFVLLFITCNFNLKISAKTFNANETGKPIATSSSSQKSLNDLILLMRKYGVKITTTSGGNTTLKPAPVNTTAKPAPVNTTAKPAPVNTTQAVQVPQTENTKYVALTFDDGPSSSLTPKLLDALDQYNAKATFFLVGSMIRSNAIVQRMYDSGHEIGNHTYDHKDLTTLSGNDVNSEIKETSDIIRSITGANPTLLRPPYGAHNSTVDNIIGQHNLPVVLWSVDPEDWKYRDSDLVYKKVTSGLVDGNIILIHDIHATTVEAAIRILRDYSNKGYKFVTVSQLAAIKNTPLNAGQAYYNFR